MNNEPNDITNLLTLKGIIGAFPLVNRFLQ